MAEDLGHIRIDFGDTARTGPDPKTPKTATQAGAGAAAGGGMANLATLTKGALGVALMAKDVLIEQARAVFDFIRSTIASVFTKAMETRFSGEVIAERVGVQMQELKQEMQSAQVLGPMYAMILKWYQELMRLLHPWKVLFQAIMAFLAGTFLSLLNALFSYLQAALPMIIDFLAGIAGFMQGMVKGFIDLARSGVGAGQAFQIGSQQMAAAGLGGPAALSYLLGGTMNTVSADPAWLSFLEDMNIVLDTLRQSLGTLKTIATNTAPAPSGAEWAAAQLREIASRSWRFQTAAGLGNVTPTMQSTFYTPPGGTYP